MSRERVRVFGGERKYGGVAKKRNGDLEGNYDFRSNLVSVFIDNLNPVIDLKGLWSIFRSFGLVQDIYLSPKSRSRRSCFAFVRFATREEATRKKSSVISFKKKISGSDLNMYEGKKNYSVPETLHGTSYAEVVKGMDRVINYDGTMKEEIMEVMKWEEKSSNDSWLKCCVVSVLKKFIDVQVVIKGLLDNSIQSSSYYLGDKNILWVFKTTKERDIFIRYRFLWEDYFSSVGLWTNAITPQTRLSWLEFRGIPLNCWCKEFFMRLGWAVGEPLVVEEETLNRSVLNSGRVLVLLPFDSHGMSEGERLFGGNVSVLKKGGEVALKTLSNNSGAELDNLNKMNVDLAREKDVEDSLDRPIIISKGKGIVLKYQSRNIVGPKVNNGKIVLDKRLENGYERIGEGDDSDSSSNYDRIAGQSSHFPIVREEPSIVNSSQLKGGQIIIDLGIEERKKRNCYTKKNGVLVAINQDTIVGRNFDNLEEQRGNNLEVIAEPINALEDKISSPAISVSHISETLSQNLPSEVEEPENTVIRLQSKKLSRKDVDKSRAVRS
ncbi:hypothetical protein Dsin_021446 [Dipteronia sinensis]|uniref:RRM domain-containing protein n=1 Tax=Dipteronia sinensis TaxID=43782 RepID=A0AAE0A108_9ROSI|nr:hypothetical protein Dsin_021446 [Dipteronia sinensis]